MRLCRLSWIILPFIGVALGACKGKNAVPSPSAQKLNVFAAASLTESFRDLGRRFEADHPNSTVIFNFAGSQQLREQLAQGAPADVFASANPKEMNVAISASLVDAASVKIFARNTLIVIYPKNNPARIDSLADLAKKGVKLDLADPAVPVGKYTMQMVDRTAKDPAYGPGFESNVLANIVSREDNVKSVVSKIRLGEADAGVVYATDVTADAAKELGVLQIPEQFNQTAEYPIAMTTTAVHKALARQFEDYVLSVNGQNVLKRHGFIATASGVETTQP